MSNEFTIEATTRSDLGKGASRRLRRLENRVPGILYGADKAPTPISVLGKDLSKALENEAFYSHILSLKLDGGDVQVVLKDLQRHPAKNNPTHVDFQRIDATHKLHMHVPLHFLNEDKCVGVKTGGGIVSHQLTEVEVVCLPKDLPEFIAVDVADLDMGKSIHLSQLTLPAGVELRALQLGEDHDLSVVSVIATRASIGEEEAKPAAPAAE
ncbi:MAG TPA: 50S ribosomal protein L25/general stress protein Ctc [Candidatus Kapabacteria bacterium]|nr:50S ribosomal protein L25/general stress protein Ctc [Candidatus Kapabacteria bacterium]